MFNEFLFHLCVCTCSNVMCVCSTLCGSNQKVFVLFVCFWKWFVSPMFLKIFQVVFVWKTCFLGSFMTYFMCKLNHKLNGRIFKFSQLWTEFHNCFASKAYPQLFMLQFFKSSWRQFLTFFVNKQPHMNIIDGIWYKKWIPLML